MRFSIFCLIVLLCAPAFAQWDAPADYYANATGAGATLKAQLTAAMSAGHIERRYGDFRFSAAIHDQDPNNSSNIILTYNGQSVGSSWTSGSTWNREHVWPQSRQPGSASNSTRGNLGDPHALRPCNPSVNSTRANKPFGFGSTTGSFGSLGEFWFTGDACRGDVARSLLYSETRWAELGLELVNGTPSGNQMSDLDSLIEWHYLDPPDEFERRRNHTIFSSAYNPQYFTNNRNAYIDRPEFVWSIYVDQMNDSMITIAGGNDNGSGSSSLELDFGSVIVGNEIATTVPITLSKSGDAGTYYLVEPTGDASSDIEGYCNAFRMNGVDSQVINVSLVYDANTVAQYDGMVLVDNLDITTQGGNDVGANDGNDFIDLSIKVVDHSNASFEAVNDVDSLTIELGQVTIGEEIAPVVFSIHNLASEAGASLTAGLDLDSIVFAPDTFLAISGPLFDNLPADEHVEFSIVGTPDQLGIGSTEFTLHLSDEDIPGATDQTLQLIVNYEVVSGVLLGDINLDGHVNLLDIQPFIGVLGSGGYQVEADVNQDGAVNVLDIDPFIAIVGD